LILLTAPTDFLKYCGEHAQKMKKRRERRQADVLSKSKAADRNADYDWLLKYKINRTTHPSLFLNRWYHIARPNSLSHLKKSPTGGTNHMKHILHQLILPSSFLYMLVQTPAPELQSSSVVTRQSAFKTGRRLTLRVGIFLLSHELLDFLLLFFCSCNLLQPQYFRFLFFGWKLLGRSEAQLF